jgi:hypothetical protein
MSEYSFQCMECGGGEHRCGRNHCMTCEGDFTEECIKFNHQACAGSPSGIDCSADDVIFKFRQVQPYIRSDKWRDYIAEIYQSNMAINGQYDGSGGVDCILSKYMTILDSSFVREELQGDITEYEDRDVVLVDIWCNECFVGKVTSDIVLTRTLSNT